MSGRKNYKELRDRVRKDPERRKRVEKISRGYDAILALADLRESLGVTQSELAKVLDVSQPNVSKLEHNDDVYLSTLWRYIAALGGKLELRAVFPGQSFTLALPGEAECQQQAQHWQVFHSEQEANLIRDHLQHVAENLQNQHEWNSKEWTRRCAETIAELAQYPLEAQAAILNATLFYCRGALSEVYGKAPDKEDPHQTFGSRPCKAVSD